MVFDAFRPEKHDPSGATQANSGDLFNRIHSESPIRLASVQGGGLEPGGNPSPGTLEPPPPPPPPHDTIINKGGDATAKANANASAKAEAVGQGGAGGSANNSISMRSVFTAPPALGGGECTVGISGGALGFALGGQMPDMACVREKTGAQKEGQLLDFTVNSGVAAINGLDAAVRNVDQANALHKQGDNGVAQAHLAVANAQRDISGGLATDSVIAAQKVLGPDAGAAPTTGWTASIFNDNSPPPAAAPVEAPAHHRIIHRDAPPPKHAATPPAADCVDEKKTKH